MQERIWSVAVVDQSMLLAANLAFVGGAFALVLIVRRALLGSDREKLFEQAMISAGVIGGFFAVYVAYGTLRNQTKQTAEAAINQDAGRLLDWERANPSIRCLYGWFDRTTPSGDEEDNTLNDQCLATIVADRALYTEALLYAEEVIFILQQAQEDQKQWVSGYAESVAYWRQDVSDDVTGLFSFHLVNRYPLPGNLDRGNADKNMRAAGVSIDNMCARAVRVRVCIEAAGRYVDSDACGWSAEPPEMTPELADLADVCRAEAQLVIQRSAKRSLGG